MTRPEWCSSGEDLSSSSMDVGLTRSSSCSGLYLIAVPTSPSSSLGSRSILGDTVKSPGPSRKSSTLLSAAPAICRRSSSIKVPKVPRPKRAQLMINSCRNGLRECIAATESDIKTLQNAEHDSSASSSAGQANFFEYEKQIKAAERYRKRLEFHLAKVEELEENYRLNHQIREGVRNMAKAYVSLSSTNKSSLQNVKYGYQECTQVMCAVEAQLENMLGTFHCKMKGMVGFARLIPGDVFEITIRHGLQKWKSKGRIGNNDQHWDHEYMIFKALVGDVLSVKAVEMKGLGKSVLLGQKNCETKDLLSSHPQMMTVNINTNGSLKLSVIITWNPLEGVEESMLFELPFPQPIPRKLFTAVNRDSISSSLNNGNVKSEVVLRRGSLNPESTDKPDIGNNVRPKSIAVMSSSTTDLSSAARLRNQQQLELRQSPAKQQTTSLEELLHNLLSVLEDVRGQYSELRCLEEQLDLWDKFIKRNGEGSDRSSNVSISIESALGAFDFLESEYQCDSASLDQHCSLDELEVPCSPSPDSTAKTADSEIESLTNNLAVEEETTAQRSLAPSPEPSGSGNDEVDNALIWHLTYCDRLLQNVGKFGPLKCRELYSLDKLEKQARILESLMSIAKVGPRITDLRQVVSDLTCNKQIKQTWICSVDHTQLSVDRSRLSTLLEKTFGDMLLANYDISVPKVIEVLVLRVLDESEENNSKSKVVTLHQFVSYLQWEQLIDLDQHLNEIANELWMLNRIWSSDRDVVAKTTVALKDSLPPTECLKSLALLLLGDNAEIRGVVAKYFKDLASNKDNREKAIVVLVGTLEDNRADLRGAACVGLRLLKATESIQALVHLCQADSANAVRLRAKEALCAFGDDGRRAYENSQLTLHGFQGIKL